MVSTGIGAVTGTIIELGTPVMLVVEVAPLELLLGALGVAEIYPKSAELLGAASNGGPRPLRPLALGID